MSGPKVDHDDPPEQPGLTVSTAPLALLPLPRPVAQRSRLLRLSLFLIVIPAAFIGVGLIAGWALFGQKSNVGDAIQNRDRVQAPPNEPAKVQVDRGEVAEREKPGGAQVLPVKPVGEQKEPANPDVVDRGRLVVQDFLNERDIKAAVRDFLKGSLDDPEFEEVRWWKAMPLENSQYYTHGFGRDVNARLWENCWKPVTDIGQTIRLKFRGRNSLGAKVLADRVFLIDGDGRVTGNMETTDLRLPRESIADYANRMREEATTAVVLGNALQTRENANAMNNVLKDLQNPGPAGGGAPRLDNPAGQPNATKPKQKAKAKKR